MTKVSLDVAIVGAGASGVLAALQIARTSPRALVGLVDAGARAARGLAYGTPYGAHLLNVPARGMSAFPDEPDHFVRWLAAKLPGSGTETYAPRPLYGEYLADLLAQSRDSGARIERIAGAAVSIAPTWTLHVEGTGAVDASSVILALGNLSPGDPPELAEFRDDRYVRDPWAPGVAAGLDPNAPVLMVGTGLTMIDLVLALQSEGHRGPIHAISRHGALPQEHAPYQAQLFSTIPPLPTPVAAARWIRDELRAGGDGGEHRDWRAVIDGLRPHTAAIWKGWSVRQRASFLRHARYLWDVHRHRVAPEVGAQIRSLLESGALDVLRGRIAGVEATALGLQVRWRRRGESREESLTVARVINCTGPNSNYRAIDLPLVSALRSRGYLIPDALGLGVETAEDGALLGRGLKPVKGLFTLGPLRRPGLWESTAIPEIRAQAAALAWRLSPAGSH